jgi:signal transduction histidine kinase
MVVIPFLYFRWMKQRIQDKLHGIWMLFLQGFLLLGLVWFGTRYHHEFETNLTGKYRQQLSNTAATARFSVISYFEKFSQNLVSLSHHPEVIRMAVTGKPGPENALCPLGNLFNVHQSEIDALILMDTSSLVIKRIANDSADLHHMMCIGNARANPHVPRDSVYFSDIFINHKDQKAITISCPVYDNEKRVGILRWMITIESINNHLLQAVDQDPLVHFAITDDDGRLLSNTRSYLSWLCENQCQCGDIKLQGSIIKNYTGLGSHHSGKLNLNPLSCEVYAAWTSFYVGERDWKLLVMMPGKELDQALWKHGAITYGFTTVALIIMLSLTILFFLTRMRKSKLETEAKYLNQLTEAQKLLNAEREQRLSAQITGQERERHRISRELHDGLGQLLLAMKLKLKSSSANEFAQEHPDTGPGMSGLLNEMIDEVKRISYGVSPAMLLELGVEKALERHCRELTERSGTRIEYVSYGITQEPDNESSIHLFRIAQEALTNAIRHGTPDEINLQLLGNRDKITLIVQDNGSGFEPFATGSPQGTGIEHMRDRVAILHGTFGLESAPGSGTTITVKIPICHEH